MNGIETCELKEFTFGVLAYNQRRFIIEQLESIKFQIHKYGKEIVNNLVVLDDCSTDDTVEVVKSWCKHNAKLFSNTEIIKNEINIGIVKNYVKLLRQIKTKHFKILAGDDLYYCNNIYEIVSNADFLISPTIKLSNGIPHINLLDSPEYLAFYDNKNLRKKLLKRLKYSMFLETPGIFFDGELIDDSLIDFISDYHYIEDVPEWFYILSKDKVKPSICLRPFVIYRDDTGVSKNTNNPIYKKVIEEKKIIIDRIHTNYNKKYRMVNPYRYYYYFCRAFATIRFLFVKRLYYNDKMINEKTMRSYLNFIASRTDCFERYIDN